MHLAHNPGTVIALIRNWIEHLAVASSKECTRRTMDDQLSLLDKELKAEFKDVFTDHLPHIRNLPMDVVHQIELTSNEEISTGRGYACPKKYLTPWKTLIEEHLAAGRIRPSNSPYALPSFVIPKADPAAAPQWVVNF
ncbi:hypothetical protein C0991_007470 [Blastosporella zonata]|nr:hypothetical protein C0991_007470 [Blastosporella zonata]